MVVVIKLFIFIIFGLLFIILASFILALFINCLIYFMHLMGISFTFINYRGEINQDNIRYYLLENKKINDVVKEQANDTINNLKTD